MDHQEYVGQTVGDYRLLRWLGGGGFGNVYLGEQERERQQVAVKVLQIHLSKQNELRAFITEARTMRLRHPHIVPLLDFGLSRDDTPFLVMEYAPEGTLRDRHPKGTSLPLRVVVEYAAQVASALQYAHDSHLVHRDVKPENMLVRADGSVLLSDFGIATAAHTTSSLSSNHGMIGTVPYMAPEQLAGKPRAASDQYALAVVIYEWLAGRTPFRGTAIEVAVQHTVQPPPSLRAQVPHLSLAVEAVLFTALAKDYKERFPSMQAFLTALQHASVSSPFRFPAFVRPALRDGTLSPALLPLGGSQTLKEEPSPFQRAVTATVVVPDAVLSREIMQLPVTGDTPSQKRFAMAPTHNLIRSPVQKPVLSPVVRVLLIVLSVFVLVGGRYAYSTEAAVQKTGVVEHRKASTCAGTFVEGDSSRCFSLGYNGDEAYHVFRVENAIQAKSWVREYPNNGTTGYFVTLQPGGDVVLENAKVTQVCVGCGDHS